MTREDIVGRIAATISGILPYAEHPGDEKRRLFEDLGLDSTSIIELMIELEESLGVVIDTENLEPDVFDTVGSLADFLQTLEPAGTERA